MALNTAISTRGNAPSAPVLAKGSPARDKNRHAFSPAPSLRQTNSPLAPAPFAILPSITSASMSTGVTPQSTTAEALLEQHASSPNPTAAALEQVVANRNALSTQNAQLLTLIEKQRAFHNQILKELKRIRKERDSYKGKNFTLDALSTGSSDKQLKRTSERGSWPNLDATSSHNPSSSTPAHSQTRKFTINQPNHHQPLKGHGSIKPHRRARFDRWAPNSPIFEETDQTV